MRCKAARIGIFLQAAVWPMDALAQVAEHSSAAATAESSLPVSRRDALRLGATQGPDVIAARAPLAATREASGAVTRLLRPPLLTVTGGYRGASGLGGPELGVSLSQEVPLANLAARRRDLSRAWSDQAHQELRQAELEGALRAGLAWTWCLEADELHALRNAAVSEAEAIGRLTQVRVTAGTGLPGDAALAASEVAAAHAAAFDGEGKVIEAYAELRHALGKSPDAPLTAVGTFDDEPPSPAAPLRQALVTSPALASAEARARLAHTQTQLVAAAQGPALLAGASYLREGTGNQVVTGFVGLPLPLVSPAAFDTARERGQEWRVAAEAVRLRSELVRAVSLAEHDRHHWREVREALKVGASAAREALRIVTANFEAGTHDVSPVLVARQRLFVAQEQLAHAKAEVARADLQYAALTGALAKELQP